MINGAKYNFYQVHWHAPSENTVNGESFPLEAHFVHQLDDDALVGGYHRLAVIGLLYELSDECNAFLDYFWDTFPEDKGTAAYDGEALDFNAKLTAALAEGYYHWYGSLTTPPCTEGVSWNLLKVRQTVCQRQVDKLRESLGNYNNGIDFNNRVPQPLNHRVVSYRHCDASTMEKAAGKWVYANQGETEANAEAQKHTWGGLCLSGREQSPIDVVTSAVVVGDAPPAIETRISAALSYVKTTPYALQLFETSPSTHGLNEEGEVHVMADGQPKGYSMINGAKYNFYQVHWHTPSENTIDGESFPLEAHFVHQLDDPALVGGYHRLAVIGLLYELSDECNEFLDYFWDMFPENKGKAVYDGAALDFNAKLDEELKGGAYHWYGSLTTPPCTEGGNWNLLKVRQTVCQRQVDALKVALGKTQHGIEFNNRVAMPLNHRVVTESGGLALAPVAPVADDSTWKYADDTLVPVPTAADAAKQAATWPGLCATGREQSPVNVDTTAVADSCPAGATGDHAITTHISAALEYVKNTGHGLQLFETNPATHDLVAGEVTEMADGQPKGYSMINGAKYNFYQVHWHSPSENTVDGVEYPLEAHFV